MVKPLSRQLYGDFISESSQKSQMEYGNIYFILLQVWGWTELIVISYFKNFDEIGFYKFISNNSSRKRAVKISRNDNEFEISSTYIPVVVHMDSSTRSKAACAINWLRCLWSSLWRIKGLIVTLIIVKLYLYIIFLIIYTWTMSCSTDTNAYSVSTCTL